MEEGTAMNEYLLKVEIGLLGNKIEILKQREEILLVELDKKSDLLGLCNEEKEILEEEKLLLADMVKTLRTKNMDQEAKIEELEEIGQFIIREKGE